jgi:hypothetical protein
MGGVAVFSAQEKGNVIGVGRVYRHMIEFNGDVPTQGQQSTDQLLDRLLRHAKLLQLFTVFEQRIIRMEDFKLVVLPALEKFFTLQFRHVFKFKAQKHWLNEHPEMLHLLKWEHVPHRKTPHPLAHVASEPKPYFVDFANGCSLLRIQKLLLQNEQIRFTEMLPDYDQLWLAEEAGRFCCEFRMTACRY